MRLIKSSRFRRFGVLALASALALGAGAVPASAGASSNVRELKVIKRVDGAPPPLMSTLSTARSRGVVYGESGEYLVVTLEENLIEH